jgi:hypothetical protein
MSSRKQLAMTVTLFVFGAVTATILWGTGCLPKGAGGGCKQWEVGYVNSQTSLAPVKLDPGWEPISGITFGGAGWHGVAARRCIAP